MTKPNMRKIVHVESSVKETGYIEFFAHPDLMDEIREYGLVGKTNTNHRYHIKVSPLFRFDQVVSRLKELENETQ